MLVILGNGGHARVLKDILGQAVLSAPPDDMVWSVENEFILGIGEMRGRIRLSRQFDNWITVSVGDVRNSTIGEGSAILYNAVINRAEIGKHCVVGCGAVVEHDTRIGDHTLIGPGAVICGACIIGQRVEIGPGVTIGKNTWICDDVTIGAGAVVVRDITTPGRYFGVPARAA